MSDKKITFKYFDIMDYEKEAAYLSRMHKEGWALDYITMPGFYHFRRCKPEMMLYQLDYNPDGTAEKEFYVKMFADCGWEYLFDFVGYSYFRRPAWEADDSGIFCDDESRLDMMTRVLRGRMLPMLIIFAVILIPQSISLTASRGITNPLAITYYLLLILYLVVFTKFAIKYHAFRRRIHRS